MSIPKKQLKIVVELMEAMLPGEHYKTQPSVILLPNDNIYLCHFDKGDLAKLEEMSIIRLIDVHDDGELMVKITGRDDFLSNFEAGVDVARNGGDLHYATKKSNGFAFMCGYEHYMNRFEAKFQLPAYNLSEAYVCHGFIPTDTKEVWRQS